MTNWQPIETMPKDGARVLLFDPKRGQREGNQPEGYPIGEWTFHQVSQRKSWWRGSEFRDDYSPTHWMPLPEPPTS